MNEATPTPAAVTEEAEAKTPPAAETGAKHDYVAAQAEIGNDLTETSNQVLQQMIEQGARPDGARGNAATEAAIQERSRRIAAGTWNLEDSADTQT